MLCYVPKLRSKFNLDFHYMYSTTLIFYTNYFVYTILKFTIANIILHTKIYDKNINNL